MQRFHDGLAAGTAAGRRRSPAPPDAGGEPLDPVAAAFVVIGA